MNKKKPGLLMAVFAAFILAAIACMCGPISQAQQAVATGQAAATEIGETMPTINAAMTQGIAEASQLAPTFNAQMTEVALTTTAISGTSGTTGGMTGGTTGGQSGSQWATTASATSQYGDPSWAATQAIGAPNTLECGDQTSAWASSNAAEVATLTLGYNQAIVPTQINIYITYNPDAVSQVEVIEANGTRHSVYTGQPHLVNSPPCPYILTIDVTGITAPVNQVAITVDQQPTGSWNEIDAVQLVGNP